MIKKLKEYYTRVISDESGRLHSAIDSQLEAVRQIISDIREKLDLVDKYERNLHIDGRADEDLYDVFNNTKKHLNKVSESLDDFCTIFTESRKINEGTNSSYERIAKTNPEKFAEIVAEFAQDMDWGDYVDDGLETYDEMWDNFVDKTYQALFNCPESIKDLIDDYGESDDPEALEIADLIDRYYINKNESIKRNCTSSSRRRYRKLVKEDIANEEKDEIIDEKGLRHYLFGDNYYSWDGWNFNKIIDALSEMEKKHKEFYRSGKKKNKVSKRNLHRYSMYVDALIQDADREAGNPVKAIDYSEIFDEFPELEQDAKRIGLKTK